MNNSKLFGVCCAVTFLAVVWIIPWLPVWGSAKTGIPAGVTVLAFLMLFFVVVIDASAEQKHPKWFDSLVDWVRSKQ